MKFKDIDKIKVAISEITRIIQSLYYALLYPAIVPIEGAVLFELSQKLFNYGFHSFPVVD
jgi:hypothetical protein